MMICDHSNSGAKRLLPPVATLKAGGEKNQRSKNSSNRRQTMQTHAPLSHFFDQRKLPPVATLNVGGEKIDGPKTRRIDVKQCRMTSPEAISSIDENYPL